MYYNWRYFNTLAGKWIYRDLIYSRNLYIFCNNNGIMLYDLMGLKEDCCYCLGSKHPKKLGKAFFCKDGKPIALKKITIYFGHCDKILPDRASKDKASTYIGMVTCFADDTMNAYF